MKKAVFDRVCADIAREGLATVSVFRDKNLPEAYGDSIGIVHEAVRPAQIIVLKKHWRSNKEIMGVILHEYGHILDRKRSRHTKRWQLFDKYECTDLAIEKYRTYPKYVLRAILQSEYMAEWSIRSSIKKFGLEDEYSMEYLNRELAITLVVKKYDLLYQTAMPRRLVRPLWRLFTNDPREVKKRLTTKYRYELDWI